MGRTPMVGIETIHQIKARIWDDADHKTIQSEFGVSYQMSVNIKAGRQYEYVPWPDGSTGGLPRTRVEQIAESKRYATRMGNSPGAAPTIKLPPLKLVKELDEAARKLGYSSIAAMQQKFLNDVILERMAKEVEEQRLKSEAYEESERIRLLPENVEARRIARESMIVERNDICDPDLQEMITEEEFEATTAVVAQVAKNENNKALMLATRIVFKMFVSRVWGGDNVLRNIYNVAGKIEKFWDENPDRRPQGE